MRRGEMDRNFAMELVRVTEAAAIMAARTMGRGDSHQSDHAAVLAMRKAFSARSMINVFVFIWAR